MDRFANNASKKKHYKLVNFQSPLIKDKMHLSFTSTISKLKTVQNVIIRYYKIIKAMFVSIAGGKTHHIRM